MAKAANASAIAAAVPLLPHDDEIIGVDDAKDCYAYT